MTRRQFEQRQQRIREGRCPRCNRPVDPWPLRRPDLCYGRSAVVCGRQWADIHAKEARLTVR